MREIFTPRKIHLLVENREHIEQKVLALVNV